jgi:aerobic carbon-monoxide dehydrogenase large subunit
LPPISVYRSAGRPEAIYVIERLIDLAAAQCGFDRVELRRRNLIPSEAMPFTNAVGVTYDNGDYPAGMEQALLAADWAGFAARKAESAARGLCRGIGVANYIEVTSGLPRERAELRVCDDGCVELVLGTMSSGQSHETTFPQLVCEWLDIPFEKIRYIANDTDRVSVGGGSHSGRSMRLASIAIGDAVTELIAKGKAIAGHMLQVAPDQITYADGTFSSGDGARVNLSEAGTAAATLNSLPEDLRGLLEGIGDITNRVGGYPYGTHVCEVEVDPETGHTQIISWTGVDDVGLAVNPMVLHGQAHGAIAQGLGQALLESCHYDPESGQLLTGSFMDYAMPRADNTPPIDTLITEIPASSHPHGIRPGGEGGTTPALGLVINAIVDALSDFGVRHIEMPATPERVWQAIQAAKAASQK